MTTEAKDINIKIDQNTLKLVLSRLDKPSYIKFIFELFGQHDFNENYERQTTYYLEKFEDKFIEQNYVHRKEGHKQGFNLTIPYFEPFDLFKTFGNLNIGDEKLKNLFGFYKRRVAKMTSNWQFWTDGDYMMPFIKFITNYSGIDEKIYDEEIIPKFEKFADKYIMDSQVAVGSIDSFFAKNPQGASDAFSRFIKKHQKEISIELTNENKYKIHCHFSEKYFNEGVIRSSLTPCEPVFSFKPISQIIAEFENLLNKNTKESELETFLTTYYKHIFGSKYNRIETQLWLKFPDLDINKKDRRLDIFLRNSTSHDWELMELKKADNIVKNINNIPTFTYQVTSGLQQLKYYSSLLNHDNVKRSLANDGIEYYYPELRLVIGKTPDIPIDQWIWLKKSNEKDLKIVTYDELFYEMKTRLDFHNTYNCFDVK